MNIVVLHHQSLLDLAIQHTGSVENAFLLALSNGKSLTDDLTAGEELSLENAQNNKDILSYYQSKKLQPATAFSQNREDIIAVQGVGHWAIQGNFIVS